MKLKKNVKLLILILGIIVLIVSTSYAVFSIRHENTSNQVISAGELELTYNSCSTMTTEMVPMSNTDGLAQTGCNVEVENTGSLDAIYKVLVYNAPNGSNHLSHDNLYVSIDSSIPVLLSTITKLENTEKYNLKAGVILVEDTTTHNIKIWIKEDATTDIVGKSINLIVDVEAEVAPEPSLLASVFIYNPRETDYFFNGLIMRGEVETLSFAVTNEVPVGVIDSWDAGEEQNGSVMAWYTDVNNNSIYEVTIGAAGGVYAPADSSNLFWNFQNLNSLNLTNFDTSKVTNMRRMFSLAGGSNFTLNLGNRFDTSKVTDMSYMFYFISPNNLYLGDKFDTSNVTDMSSMFSYMNVYDLNLGDKFNTSNVTNMMQMFYYTAENIPTFTLDLGDKFDTSSITDMSSMFEATGRNSPNLTLNLRSFDVNTIAAAGGFFLSTGNSSHKVYASNSNISSLSGKGFTGTIINCTTSPSSCP